MNGHASCQESQGRQVTRRARWRDDRGDQHSRSFRLKVDAERFMTQLEHARLNGAYVDAGVGGVAEWVGTMHLRGLSASRTRQANHLMTSVLDDAVKDGRLVRNAGAGMDLLRLETKPRRCACRMSTFVAGGSRSAGPARRSKAGSCSAPPSRTRPGGFRCRSRCWRGWRRRSAARRLTTWCSPHHGVATCGWRLPTRLLRPCRQVDRSIRRLPARAAAHGGLAGDRFGRHGHLLADELDDVAARLDAMRESDEGKAMWSRAAPTLFDGGDEA